MEEKKSADNPLENLKKILLKEDADAQALTNAPSPPVKEEPPTQSSFSEDSRKKLEDILNANKPKKSDSPNS